MVKSKGAIASSPVEKPLSQTLLMDIECSPHLGWYYDAKKEYNILRPEQYSFIYSFSYQWEGEKRVHVIALPDFPLYKKDPLSDFALMGKIHELFSKADIIIGHNGENFDIKIINARLIKHGFSPPPPYKTSDTLKLAKKIQNSGSNRLGDLARYYDLGFKGENIGTDAVLRIAKGEGTRQDWARNREYNAQDTYILGLLWPRLRPWDRTPNINIATRNEGACSKCGSKDLEHRGFSYTRTSESPRLRCKECGAWNLGKRETLAKKIHIV